jgi:hypothetical protein
MEVAGLCHIKPENDPASLRQASQDRHFMAPRGQVFALASFAPTETPRHAIQAGKRHMGKRSSSVFGIYMEKAFDSVEYAKERIRRMTDNYQRTLFSFWRR